MSLMTNCNTFTKPCEYITKTTPFWGDEYDLTISGLAGMKLSMHSYSSILSCQFQTDLLSFNEKWFTQSIYILPDLKACTKSLSLLDIGYF